MASALARLGLHLPNCRVADFRRDPAFPAEPQALGLRLGAVKRIGETAWLKALAPDHTPADCAVWHAFGWRVLLRAPGEGTPTVAAVRDLLHAYAGVVDVLELGNEPADPGAHAVAVAALVAECRAPARAAGIALCAPGWRNGSLPPSGDPVGQRIAAAYGQLDAIGFHAYEPWDLAAPVQALRLQLWMTAFPGKPIYITEAGIAAASLAPEAKAARYAAWIRTLPPAVGAAFVFLLGGTPGYARFTTPGTYDPAGASGYWLTSWAWQQLGELLRQEAT